MKKTLFEILDTMLAFAIVVVGCCLAFAFGVFMARFAQWLWAVTA